MNNWTREETIIAFNVYCKVPFKNSSKTHPTIIKYANILGRSPSSLNMKIGNFGRLDPELKKQGITGLKNGSKIDELVWIEFNNNWEKLAFESELLISKYLDKPIEELLDFKPEELEFKKGKERESLVKLRVNQSFFRSTILSSYNLRCCISGLNIPECLVASHIKPWSKDTENRLNPHNGLCLNSLLDKAYDKGLITVTPDYKVKLGDKILSKAQDVSIQKNFIYYDNLKIILPDRFSPSLEFLDYHQNEIFNK